MKYKGKHPAAVWFFVICLFWIGYLMAISPQSVQILRSTGKIAALNIGSRHNIHVGDQFQLYRNNRAVAMVEATRVTPKLTRVELTKNHRQESILPSDQILIGKSPGMNQSRRPVKSNYIGPTVSYFIPLGDLKNDFTSTIGYGGSIGFQFRPDLDVSTRFFFAASGTDWSFWNFQMLGRRYFADNLTFDFGYGIAYPVIQNSLTGASHIIRLGFLAGLGVSLPVARNTSFELGVLYHNYPNFGEKAGQFLTIEGRLHL